MRNVFLICLLSFFVCKAFAQEIHNKAFIDDFTDLIQLLEETHPDPYSAFGGRVFFHIEAERVKRDLADGEYSRPDFVKTVSSFLARLYDGHTVLSERVKNEDDRLLPVNFRVIPAGLLLGELPVEYSEHLGCPVEKINHLPVAEILELIPRFYPCENSYGAYSWLLEYGRDAGFYHTLFAEEKDEVVFDLLTDDGERVSITLPFSARDRIGDIRTERLPRRGIVSGDSYMFYKYPDQEKDVMYFKLSQVMARENFEAVVKYGWDNAESQVRNHYRYALQKEMPESMDEALAGIPSFSEIFYEMLLEMKDKGSQTLVIDLRGNGGGWTPITLPALYMLYGDEYLSTDMGDRSYSLLSPLYLKKLNTTLEQFNGRNNKYKLGDYFSRSAADDKDLSPEERRAGFIENSLCAIPDKLELQQGNPLYRPEQIYVVTNTWTFSAAFHFTFYLWKMGAKVVGVPSMQAPNTFMEQTPFVLPHTGIAGSISNSMQIFLPGDDPRAKIFYPDIMLSRDEYKEYAFDYDAEIMYLLDLQD